MTSHEVYGADIAHDGEVDFIPLIPEGEYLLEYVRHRTTDIRGEGRLWITFVIKKGEHKGELIEAYYPVELAGPPAVGGAIRIRFTQKYFQEMSRLFPITRGDRVSPRRLVNQPIIGRVQTVESGWAGNAKARDQKYSKVAEMIRLADHTDEEYSPID